MKKPRTMKLSEVSILAFCNSKKLPLFVNFGGKRKQWVGIGWIDAGPLTGREVVIVDG